MNALRQHAAHSAMTLRLHFRNRMALLYGYLFPIIFLIAFWVLYRYDKVPLARHLGELLTVTILGGACFGLPTSMVSERERGVWRRYRLTPVSTGALVGSTVAARYVAVITAGLLQFAIAMAFGMPLPRHPIQLFAAFTLVTFAFLGLGLVIAMLADNVPAVQALGQCIFLPMLIIGGVAVQLSSLPDWALHVSAFFPGRYAVQAMQACVTGTGLGAVRFSLLALLLIGIGGCLAGARLFRWDAQQRFAASRGKGWLAVALGTWIGVGLLAEARGHIGIVDDTATISIPVRPPDPAPAPATSSAGTPVLRAPVLTPAERAAEKAQAPTKDAPAAPPLLPEPAAPPNPQATSLQATICPSAPGTWQAVTIAHIEADLSFERGRLPPDSSVVTPIASDDMQPDDDVAKKLNELSEALAIWPAGKGIDTVQRTRNLLYAAGVPDVFQMDIERFVPWYVFERIGTDIPKDDLVKALYWIACTPDRGADPNALDMRALGLPGVPGDIDEVRNRTAIYGVKLLGRLLGKIQ